MSQLQEGLLLHRRCRLYAGNSRSVSPNDPNPLYHLVGGLVGSRTECCCTSSVASVHSHASCSMGFLHRYKLQLISRESWELSSLGTDCQGQGVNCWNLSTGGGKKPESSKKLGGAVMSMAQKGNGKRTLQDAEQKAKLEIMHV